MDTELQQLAKTDRNPIQETRYQELLKQQGGGVQPAGMGDIASVLKQQQADTAARFAQNKGDITDFLGRFNTAVPQIINDVSGKYNLNDLLGQANATGSRVADLTNNISGYGAGGYANASQVDKAINMKYLPAAQQATANLQRGQGLAQAEETMRLQPFQTESQLLNERLAREATGYTAAQQSELDALIKQMTLGAELTKAQLDYANQLAIKEGEYQTQIQVAELKRRPVNLGGGQVGYINEFGQLQIVPNGANTGTGGGSNITKYLGEGSNTSTTPPPSWFLPFTL